MSQESGQSHDLQDFMDQVETDLALEYRRITKRSRQDPGTAGDEGENNWQKVLAEWLPSTLRVVTKGRIISANGDSSPQVDVLVLHPSYPERLVTKKQYLASGVIAAFECKLTLRKRDFAKIAETSRAIRRMTKPRDRSPYSALHAPLVYGVLAHSSEWSSDDGYSANGDYRDPGAIAHVDRLLNEALAGDHHPREALDVMCIADLACWWRFVGVAGPALWPSDDLWQASRRLYGWNEGGAVYNQYTRWQKFTPGEEGPPNPIYVLIAKLWRRLAWEIPEFRAIAEYWNLAIGTGQNGAGAAARNWPLDVLGDLSAGLERGVKTGHWEEWNIGFH